MEENASKMRENNGEMRENDRKKRIRNTIGAAVIASIFVGVGIFAGLKDLEPDEDEAGKENSIVQASLETDADEELENQPENQPTREKTDLEIALDEKRPVMVTLRNEEKSERGSGFILELQEDVIYICTNRHVIENYENWEVELYDGSTVMGKKEGVSQVYDVGIVRVETANIPEQLLKQLSAVNIDLEYWTELDGKQLEVGFVSTCQSEDGDKYVTGLLLNTLAEFSWGNGLRHSEFQLKFVDGDSGSAIFDEAGQLISMVCGTSYEDKSGRPRRWGIPLSGIATCYIEIVQQEH